MQAATTTSRRVHARGLVVHAAAHRQDTPALANLAWGAVRTAGAMLDWLFCDYFDRMPNLKIALSEGNIGWIPYFLERAEQVVDKQRHWVHADELRRVRRPDGRAEVVTRHLRRARSLP